LALHFAGPRVIHFVRFDGSRFVPGNRPTDTWPPVRQHLEGRALKVSFWNTPYSISPMASPGAKLMPAQASVPQILLSQSGRFVHGHLVHKPDSFDPYLVVQSLCPSDRIKPRASIWSSCLPAGKLGSSCQSVPTQSGATIPVPAVPGKDHCCAKVGSRSGGWQCHHNRWRSCCVALAAVFI
jgi:hypothetical protein